MKNITYSILISLILISCSEREINSKEYFNVPYQNEDNKPKLSIKLNITPVIIDTTIESSFVGNLWICKDTICFSDLYFNYIYRIRNNGSIIDRQIGKGKGPNEILSFDYNILHNDGYLLVSSSNSYMHKFYTSGVKLSSVKIDWKASRAIGLKMMKKPDPKNSKAYEFDFGIDDIVHDWDKNHIAIGLTSSIEKFNGYFNSDLYYSFGRILAIVNTENGKIEKIIGRRSPIYLEQKNIPNFDHFCFDVKGDEVFLNFWPDHKIYVIDKQNDKALYSFGVPGREMNINYNRTNSYEEAEMQRVTDVQTFGYYFNIIYDNNSKLLFRSYTKGGNAPTDGLQIYREKALLADLDVPVGFKIIGSVNNTLYAQIIDIYNESTKMIMYKVIFEGL